MVESVGLTIKKKEKNWEDLVTVSLSHSQCEPLHDCKGTLTCFSRVVQKYFFLKCCNSPQASRYYSLCSYKKSWLLLFANKKSSQIKRQTLSRQILIIDRLLKYGTLSVLGHAKKAMGRFKLNSTEVMMTAVVKAF